MMNGAKNFECFRVNHGLLYIFEDIAVHEATLMLNLRLKRLFVSNGHQKERSSGELKPLLINDVVSLISYKKPGINWYTLSVKKKSA